MGQEDAKNNNINNNNSNNKREKVDPRQLSLSALLQICSSKKISDNYKLLPGLLPNQLNFAKAFLANDLQSKHFKTCLICPIDHRVLSTILVAQFPKEYHFSDPNIWKNTDCLDTVEKDTDIEKMYEKIYRMEEVVFYKYYLELEMHYDRKSIKRIRARYQPIANKLIKWKGYPHLKKQVDKLLEQIQNADQASRLMEDLQQEIKDVDKRRIEEVEAIRTKLKCSFGVPNAPKPAMKIGQVESKKDRKQQKCTVK